MVFKLHCFKLDDEYRIVDYFHTTSIAAEHKLNWDNYYLTHIGTRTECLYHKINRHIVSTKIFNGATEYLLAIYYAHTLPEKILLTQSIKNEVSFEKYRSNVFSLMLSNIKVYYDFKEYHTEQYKNINVNISEISLSSMTCEYFGTKHLCPLNKHIENIEHLILLSLLIFKRYQLPKCLILNLVFQYI